MNAQISLHAYLSPSGASDQLYEFNSHYFEHHPLEQADRRAGDVEGKLKETLALLDSVQGQFCG